MILLKCKMCGGDIELSSDKTYGTCDSCGSNSTFPKVDDEQKAGLFNRGNTLRMRSEFDKAAAVFERIIEQDNTDAEAHWCLALCRYGIEYVEDPRNGERIPTCHRVSYDSFLDDIDYIAATQYSDEYTASIYTTEAKKIADIQKAILTISKLEEPFDIFICYKETTAGGSRTKDSVIAQDIYNELAKEGYKIFFSRITLEEKLGAEYEPYIFAALSSAKVMLVIGTSYANFNAVWVRNEWSRFLSIMKNDQSRILIPCYRDMDPYDLPDELAMRQSQDMSKIGFMQDLVRGIKKVLESKTITMAAKATATGVATDSLERLIQNCDTYLKLSNYPAATEVFERISKEYPEDYRGWWGLMVCNTRNFFDVFTDQSTLNIWFRYVKQLANPKEFSELEEIYIEYTKKVGHLAATEDMNATNNTINNHNKKIQSLLQEVASVESSKKSFIQTHNNIMSNNSSQTKLSKSKQALRSITIRQTIGGAMLAFAILIEIASFSTDLNGLEGIFLLSIIIGIGLLISFKRGQIKKDIQEATTQLNKDESYKNQQKNQFNQNVRNFDNNITSLQQQIATYQGKIDGCKKYLDLGEDRIATMFFAKKCEAFGVQRIFDNSISTFRKAAFDIKD